MVLDLPHNLVRVIQPPVGGSFGGKDDQIYQMSAEVAIWLITGKPVRMVYSREGEPDLQLQADPMHIRIRLALIGDGTLRACKFEGLMDRAYASESTFTAGAAASMRWACTATTPRGGYPIVYTNNGYYGAFRGFGNTEVCSHRAGDRRDGRAVGMDPMDFRMKNCLHVGDDRARPALTESVGLPECLKTARRISDWDRKRAEYSQQTAKDLRRGIGMAALYHGTSLGAEGLDYASSTIAVEQDYSVDLTSGLTDYGTGSRTVFTLIAAEGLGVSRPHPHAAARHGHRDRIRPNGGQPLDHAGRQRARVAADNLRQTLDYAVADLLGCELHQLIRCGEAYVGPDEEPAAWEKVVDHARAMGLALSAHGKWTAPRSTGITTTAPARPTWPITSRRRWPRSRWTCAPATCRWSGSGPCTIRAR